MQRLLRIGALLAAGFVPCFVQADGVRTDDEHYVQRLFQRLTGSPLSKKDPEFKAMMSEMTSGDLKRVAHVATSQLGFYDVTLRNWVAPMSNVDQAQQVDLNDFQATIIGAVRDDLDARTILTGNYLYSAFDDLGLPPVSHDNNDHYAEFDKRGLSLGRYLQRVEPQWSDMPEYAGIFTSRGWGQAHYNAGTNRRSVEYAFQVFLCTPIAKWKDSGISDYHVRRDVDRNPSGDPGDYQNRCRHCHAPMDAMAGAFARFDFLGGKLTYYAPPQVAPKYNQNNHVFTRGFQTRNDTWINYAKKNHNTALGWRGATEGQGLLPFAQMIADAKGFGKCMATKVFKELCRRTPVKEENNLIENLAQEFEDNGFRIKSLFENVATQEACISRTL